MIFLQVLQNDIEVATNIARDMVTKYGMSDVLGPIDFKGKEPYEMQLLVKI